MLFILISKHAISPQNVLPKFSSEVSKICWAGRNSPLNAFFQNLCLFLIIFNISENTRKREETPCDNVLFEK